MTDTQAQSIGVDTGGTFTDFAYFEGSQIKILKVPSTRANPANAVITGLRTLELPPGEIVHGSTVATNALLERRGARTALVTTAGFKDLIEIGRQNRPELYNLVVKKPSPLVPRSLRFGVTDRVLPSGEAIEQPLKEELDTLTARLKAKKVESVALCLLFSFVNPANERHVAEHLRKHGFNVSVSSELLPEFREYERLSTITINAYTSPVLERHVDRLLADEAVPSLRIMASNGGSLPAEEAKAAAVHTILSGPAAGVIAARRIADIAGYRRIITFDMGGTSTDVSLSTGEIPFTSSCTCAGLPVKVPVIDIHTIGAGGGSVAHFDAGGALRVGPRSVGSEPGPACYGKGSDATLTDADLLLGRLPESGLLGGGIPLDRDASHQAVGKLASQAKMRLEEFAEGIVAVADSGVEQALRLISVERGHDPWEFLLVAFGGAGPVHAASLMTRLGISALLVPPNPGVFSACGLLFADTVRDYSQTVFQPTGGLRGGYFFYLLDPLKRKADSDLARAGMKKEDIQYLMSAGMRYMGQSFTLNIRMQKGIEEAFHAAHEHEYGYCDRSRPVEIVTVRLRAIVKGHRRRTRRRTMRIGSRGEQARAGTQKMRWGGKWH
jgi:N-methylhydantoinase A